MSVVTEEIAGHIGERVEEINAEIRRLEAAKAALLGNASERTEDPRLTRLKASHVRRRRTSGVRIEMPPIVHETEAAPRVTRRRGGASWKRLRDEATKGADRMRLGTRQAQVLALVNAKPGISSSAIGAETGSKTYAYTCVRILRGMGLIDGGHDGWRATHSGDVADEKRSKA